ncbi:MAG: preprotein translocase subunit SecA [Phycisphaerales bacterium]|nr:preprotein translocase subunit SecA [Phycisphaerales bacterium]
MMSFIAKLLGGNKSEKNVKEIQPLVGEINQEFNKLSTLSHDELRNKTTVFKKIIQAHLEKIDREIVLKTEEAEAVDIQELHKKDIAYKAIDELKKTRLKHVEEVLLKILPSAFAVVKETARRLSTQKTITVTATEQDRRLATQKKHITIKGDEAVWANSWQAAGATVTWNMLHYDVQLIGGIVLHQGKISEMATGEGKTLVSTLPAYLNALVGEGVHIVTVNDYLARRDCEWNGPLFEFLGLKVDCIDKHRPNSLERKQAYEADIIYGTNNEFGFDYLRDNMVHNPDEIVQRKHFYAIVDEVDSVLIDDARTPLIISGPTTQQDNVQQFFDLKPRIDRLVEIQKKTVNQYLNSAKKQIADNKKSPKEGGFDLFTAHRGLPKNGALIKYLSEPGMRVIMQEAENYYLADQQREMKHIDTNLFFYIDEKNNSVELTDKGIQTITAGGEDPHFFIIPDISVALAEIDRSTLSDHEKHLKKESIINDYAVKAERIHIVQQLLKAYTLFDKDVEYVVLEGQVKIVDEQTGRILEGRRYSDGLHQAIEAKENVKIEATNQTYATITLQNYFRMYHKLSGMTGTAETEAGELWEIYKLDVVTIPTHLKMIRKDHEDLVFKTKREKYKSIIEEIEKLRSAGRPCLVGTTSIDVSELIGRMLKQKQIPHNVLNAKQHAREAQIITEAGLSGAVTIATNMAGRGTDIKLGAGVQEKMGLAILGTERHESRRVDRQLRGRAGRQGDPGSSQFFISLEDDLMRMFGSERIAKIMDFAGYKEGEVIQHKMITKSIERAQRKVEENNFGIRKRLLEYDDIMNKQRTVIYAKRNHALFGNRLSLDVDNAFYAVAQDIVQSSKEENKFDTLKLNSLLYLACETKITIEQFSQANNLDSLTDQLYRDAIDGYERKKKEIAEQSLPAFQNILRNQGRHIEQVVVPFTDGRRPISVLTPLQKNINEQGNELSLSLEKIITILMLDEAWQEHLRAMDDLKQSVQTASYEQKDPLVIYKIEAFNLFNSMITKLNRDIVQYLCHAVIINEANAPLIKEGRQQKRDTGKLRELKMDGTNNAQGSSQDANTGEELKREPIKVGPKTGRNDLCPCGSGKKYKHCHGKDA